jgi:hypothetical protein
MPEQSERPQPHGDPLDEERLNRGTRSGGRQVDSGKRDPRNLDRGSGAEENAAQRQSDGTNDATALPGVEQPTRGTTSDANGLSAGDEAEGASRKKRYDEGAGLVSRVD